MSGERETVTRLPFGYKLTRPPRGAHSFRARVVASMVTVGALIVFVHDFAYRRTTTDGDFIGPYGLVSHAAGDMLGTIAALAIVVWVLLGWHDCTPRERRDW